MKKSLLLSAVAVAYAITMVGFPTPPAHGFANSAPNFDCMSCHPGAMKTDMVKLANLPSGYEPGKSYTLTLTLNSHLESMGDQQGGFAVRASAGQLIVQDDLNTQISNEILTHTLQGSAQRTWTFTWQAPGEAVGGWQFRRKAEPGPHVNLTVMAVAANGDFSSMGDEVGAAGFAIPGN